jgi:hypothetical protein
VLLFVWGSRRILPVRVFSLQIAEQSFDARLNPILAQLRVTLLSQPGSTRLSPRL